MTTQSQSTVHPVPEAEASASPGVLDRDATSARQEGVPAALGEPRDASKKRTMRTRIVGAAILAVVLGALAWWLHARRYEDTDDAQIDGNISAVSPRVQGTVTAVHVVDNEEVEAGDVLVDLDTTDLAVAVAQAKANVAEAQAQVLAENPNVPITVTSNRAAAQSADADVESARTDLDAAQAELDQALANDQLAQAELGRARQLVARGSIARSEFDRRTAAANVSRAAVVAAQKRLAGKRAKLDAALSRRREIRQNSPRQVDAREATMQVRRANLELAQARLEEARLNLGYARIVAPADGIVGKKSVNVGDRVQPGQELVALTQSGDLWVTANFRETQVRHMRAGQRAKVHVDALSRDFEGRVESFAGATGSRYSLLPPENATGNYVKVVQRIPVRIRLEPGQEQASLLRPGMSVEPEVKVR